DYVTLLHRTPSPAEVTGWVRLLVNGTSDEQVLAGFTSSAEYYQQAGGDDQGWVEALYRDLLGRDADGGGGVGWVGARRAGASRFRVAYGIASSVDHVSLVVAADYQRLLGRSAAPSEVAGWVNNVRSGIAEERVVAAFVASDEFYTSRSSSIENWVNAAYAVVLQRSADASGFNHWKGYLEAARFSR